jgi:citrate lyase subunit beta/citryl-CoA lyase
VTSAGVSWLFVPGSRPERFAKAVAAGPSQVIVDLEDAVAIADKESARGHTARWLSDGGTAWVRINADGTPWHLDDLSALEGCRGLRGVVVPKSEQPDALSRIADRLPAGAGVIALVESALGIQVAATIAAARGVDRLAFGSIDFALDIDAAETDEALLLARSALVLASRAAVLPPPIDGVTVETRDTDVVRLAALRARSLGFGGKLCIHPAQVPIVHEAFAPTSADLEWARRVLQAAGQGEAPNGVATMDGAMVDKPVLERALRIVSRGGG